MNGEDWAYVAFFLMAVGLSFMAGWWIAGKVGHWDDY